MISANHYSVPVASYIPWNIIHIVTPKWDVCGKFTFQRVPLQLGHLGALIFIFSEITMIWRLWGTFYLPSLFFSFSRLRKYLPTREKKQSVWTSEEMWGFSVLTGNSVKFWGCGAWVQMAVWQLTRSWSNYDFGQ